MLSVILSLILSAAACSSSGDMRRKMLHYVDREFGYSLTFPDSWSNYRVFKSKEFIERDIRVSVFFFCLPTRSRDWQPDTVESPYAVIFSIYIFTHESWGTYTARYGSNPGKDTILGKSDRYVFILRYPSGLPIDLYRYMKEIGKVTGTFTVIKK